VDGRLVELLARHKVIRLLQDEALLARERTALLLSWRQQRGAESGIGGLCTNLHSWK
jgi:hypothetical protein